ncbi:MAG: methyltransferase family protein [Endomicrobiales bacterium]
MRNSFTVLYVLFFAATFLLRKMIRARTLRAERIKGRVVARWTTAYLFYAYLIILFGSLLEYFVLAGQVNLSVSAAGALLYALGIAGRQWAFNALGGYWSVDVEIREKQEIIRKGPYRYLRHPNNVSHALEVLGLTLVPNAYYALAAFVLLYLPVIVLRSLVEENAMAGVQKEKYEAYKKDTWAFFPFPFAKGGGNINTGGGNGHV